MASSVSYVSHAYLCFVMQVTVKLAALYAKAVQQQSAPRTIQEHVQVLTCRALNMWLGQVMVAVLASPESHAVASVVQQLQESQLLQQMAAGMDAAAARLTAAVAALTAATAITDSTNSSSSSSTAMNPHVQLDIIQQQLSYSAVQFESCLIELQNVYMVSCTLSPTGTFKLSAALPAAPAAVRLILTTFQSYSKLQQLLQQPWSGRAKLGNLASLA
jgi:hypothetical protein